MCEKELTSIGVIDSLAHLVSTLSVTQLRVITPSTTDCNNPSTITLNPMQALDVENASDLRLTIADFLHTE